MTRAPRQPGIVLAIALCLLASACGARWTDDQQAEVRSRGSIGLVAADDAAIGGRSAVDDGALQGPAAGAGSGVTVDPVGTAPPGGGDQAAGPGTLPCEASSSAPGVTDSTLTIGSISSLSGPVPGLGSSSAAATRAYVAFRNASGGVCGRRIVLRESDDGTDLGRYRTIVSELAPQVFGLAGGFAFGDIGAADIVRQANLPVVNIPSGEAMQVVPSVSDMNPPFERLDQPIGKYRYLRGQGVQRVAMVYLAVDQSRFEANLQRRLMEAAGLQIAEVRELPLSTLSFDSAARAVANSAADYMFFIGDASSNVSMARAMLGTGYKPKFSEYFTFSYGTDFISSAGSAAEGAVTWLRTLPNEEADRNVEVASFVRWMDRIAPNDVLDAFAADAWAGSKAFFDSLESLPGPISREAFIAQLRATETFDAGGMFGPIRLGAELTNGCHVGMRVEGGRWRRIAPAEGFLC